MNRGIKKIVLAYSGGLDTSVILRWLQETYEAEVIAFCADLGQGEDLQAIKAKAQKLGVKKVYVEDLRETFVKEYVFPMLRGNAMYEGSYLLGTSIARPLIARRQAEIALKEGAEAVSHGATGKGNDQVRFELTYMALAPGLKIIAPWREWTMRSRRELIEYADRHGIPVTATKAKPYSMDLNLFHVSYEGGILEDPWESPPDEIFQMTVSPEKAPNKSQEVEIDYEAGNPVAVDGKKMSPAALLASLNKLGGAHGIGRVDLVENRYVGMKSRGIYETPGGTLLYSAHSELEQLVLDRRTLAAKDLISPRYADLVYEGRWWTTERDAYDAFVNVTQERVTGSVTLKLFKGNASVIGRESEYALYDERFVTFGEDDVYQQSDAAGFIRLYGLSARVRAIRDQELAAARIEQEKAAAAKKEPASLAIA